MDTRELLQRWSNHLVTPRTYRGPLHIKQDVYIGTIIVKVLTVGVLLSIAAIFAYNLWMI